jgi:histidinol phosphatase-like enzyme
MPGLGQEQERGVRERGGAVHRAVFVRQEGVILCSQTDVTNGFDPEFLPGAIEALRRLVDSGLGLVVMIDRPRLGPRGAVTEQPRSETCRVIAKAIGAEYSEVDVLRWAANAVEQEGTRPYVERDGICFAERKPSLGIAASYLIGNTLADIQVGQQLGCRAGYLVLTGHGRRELVRCYLHGERSFRVAFDLKAAVEDILLRERCPVMEAVPASLRKMAVQGV